MRCVWVVLLIACWTNSCGGRDGDRIGCLIDQTLCYVGEQCIDDNLFGTCQGRFDELDPYQYSLDVGSLELFQQEINYLISHKFTWRDHYTQCVLAYLLASVRYNVMYTRDECDNQLMVQAWQGLELLQSGAEGKPLWSGHDNDRATIYGTPMYFYDENTGRYTNDPGGVMSDRLGGEDLSDERRDWGLYGGRAPSLPPVSGLEEEPALEGDVGPYSEADMGDNFQSDTLYGDLPADPSQGTIYAVDPQWLKSLENNIIHDDATVQFDSDDEDEKELENNLASQLRDSDSRQLSQQRDRPDEAADSVLDKYLPNNFYESLLSSDQNLKYNDDEPGAANLLDDTALVENLGNKRDNNADEGMKESVMYGGILAAGGRDSAGVVHVEKDVNGEDEEIIVDQKSKKVKSIDNSDVVHADHAFISVKDGFSSWEEGVELAERLSELEGVPFNALSDIRVENNDVSFRVDPRNPKNVNASDFAEAAVKPETQKQIEKMMPDVKIVSAGIGDETKVPVEEKSPNSIYVVTFIVCGVIAGMLLAVVSLSLIRRHRRSRDKVKNLANNGDVEVTKDYQDLCRQRMAGKAQKPEPVHAAAAASTGAGAARVSSVSQGEQLVKSPSSRSSTSSWSEEPATSNMDISTGHMILSYMEDHLKNKDRLQEEWGALCSYEAEPSATDIATLPQNAPKNRYPDVLPYNHSRVILNDTTNLTKSDYINASTITDHDPRNPAYIATQGPLQETVAEFWQTVWEQGSVVIIMLARLVEKGMSLCYRYWPEEGSELYHVYEVHLVSEHVWCDDYIVRSFYLKNLHTNETRTVTQFHFISWPENGVPSSTKALLEFRRKVNKSYRSRSCPIVVHCSDGSSRTGTYVLLDMVLNRMMKGAKEIDIAAALEHIRDQRMGMVKTKEQFEFVLMAVAEEVNAILKALPQ